MVNQNRCCYELLTLREYLGHPLVFFIWLWAYPMKVILRVPDEGYSECTWWRLFWVYLMKVILSVPDEGYSECTWWRLFWVYLMKVILSVPDEGYSACTWWRLFQKRIVCTKFDIYVFIINTMNMEYKWV